MVLRSVSLPAFNCHSHTVIFLHGRRSNPRDFSWKLWDSRDRRGDSLQHIFPTVKWVFPEAEDVFAECSQRQVRQWFDISDLSNPEERPELQAPGLRDVVPPLIELIRREASAVGLGNVILAGISQGGAAAIHTLLNYPKPGSDHECQHGVSNDDRLCAFIGLSSWMSLGADSVEASRELLHLEEPAASDRSDAIFRNTPVFIGHCADDPIVPIEQGRRLRDVLSTYGMTVTWKEYPTGGHWINDPQGIEDIVAFLTSQGLARAPRA
ncbi:phospholipase/carboxylesterase family protein [Poronia punctata]|nr:phospholipase/carboxylesterase family protein [Poronia punctata]